MLEGNADRSRIEVGVWLFVLTGFSASIVYFYPPFWRTNDDVAMAMFAHGYGLAHSASDQLFFSNALWGKVVQLFQPILNMEGYALMSLMTVLVCVLVLFALVRRNYESNYLAALILAYGIFQSLISPQFTVNAGLLAIVCIFSVLEYERTKSSKFLFLMIVFGGLSFLVRSIELCFMVVVAAPLLIRRSLMVDRRFILALLGLIVLGVGAFEFDRKSYEAEEWKAFNELNTVRAAYTDFGAHKVLFSHPEILRSEGYSKNDIKLVKNWFFEDDNISDPLALKRLLSAVEAEHVDPVLIRERILKGLKVFIHKELKVTAFIVLCLLLVCFSWRFFLSIWLVIGVAVLLGILGRPGISRVFEPALLLLLIYSYYGVQSTKYKKRIVLAVLLAAVPFQVQSVLNSYSEDLNHSRVALAEYSQMNQVDFVVWGSALPYKYLYPLMNNTEVRREKGPKLYAFGVTALAPSSVASVLRGEKQGFLARFSGSEGVNLVAKPGKLELLRHYCQERLGGVMHQQSPFPSFVLIPLFRVSCINSST